MSRVCFGGERPVRVLNRLAGDAERRLPAPPVAAVPNRRRHTEMTTIQNLKIADLKPYPGNPRDNDGAVPGVVASIRQYGFRTRS